MSMFKSLFGKEVRTRFAPSPTGPFHIGGARTALFNVLFARKQGGKFILRIEDTDLERSDPKYERDIIEGLKWLGLDWDEGVGAGGSHGPYRQSERLPLYAEYLKKLIEGGRAFYCFHSKEHLDKEYEEQIANKKNPAHICEFRKMPLEDAERRLQKEGAIIRFKIPFDEEVCFDDLIRGKVCFNSDTLGGDFSLAKAASPDSFSPLYNFAVVIDDFSMEITHVIRGEDHISNTPKQILVQKTLGLPLPKYAHLPLILGPDKSKMSKRHGAVSVIEYKEKGYLPEAIVNFLSLLGWNPGTEKEIFTMKELVKEFDLEKVQKGGAIFNIDKLDWLNGYYLRQMPLSELAEAAVPFLKKENLIAEGTCPEPLGPELVVEGLAEGENDLEYIKKVAALEQPRLKRLSEVGERAAFFFQIPNKYRPEILVWRDMSFKDVIVSLNISLGVLEAIPETNFKKDYLGKALLKEAARAKNNDKGRLLWPLRVALTGLEASPGPFEIMEILGKKRSVERVKAALVRLS